MKHNRMPLDALAIACLAVFCNAGDAHAYLDPGTGSYVIQLLVAGALAAVFSLKMFWKNVKGFFGGLISRGRPAGEDEK